ncbi:MAG: putative diflavin flavoprotein A 3 [Anaerolineales bacterium]|nr:putative diflavin flavoprotein A 3 [Anaerolineales bacterium]
MANGQPAGIPAGYTSQEDRALRMLTYGCYVVSAADAEGALHAATVAWVSQVSFDPPLIMVAAQADGRLAEAIEASEQFAVNVMSDAQVDLAERYVHHASYSPPDPEDFESGIDMGVPVLKQAPSYVECQLVGKLTGGDHTVYVGRVGGGDVRDDEVKPLMLADTPWVYAGLMGRE